jgi:hypothetical protein
MLSLEWVQKKVDTELLSGAAGLQGLKLIVCLSRPKNNVLQCGNRNIR